MLNIGSLSTGASVTAVKMDLAKIKLNSPVCTEIGEKIALSRKIEKHWRLVDFFFFFSFGSVVTSRIVLYQRC